MAFRTSRASALRMFDRGEWEVVVCEALQASASQDEAAERLGVDVRTLRRWKREIVSKDPRRDVPRSVVGLAKYRAANALAAAIKRGTLPAAKTQQCSKCGAQANEYHHPQGYSKSNRLNVLPMCKACHNRIHHPRP